VAEIGSQLAVKWAWSETSEGHAMSLGRWNVVASEIGQDVNNDGEDCIGRNDHHVRQLRDRIFNDPPRRSQWAQGSVGQHIWCDLSVIPRSLRWLCVMCNVV
jgi:hypothetical protein